MSFRALFQAFSDDFREHNQIFFEVCEIEWVLLRCDPEMIGAFHVPPYAEVILCGWSVIVCRSKLVDLP